MTMDYSPLSERENWLFLKVPIIPETGESTPTKIGIHHVTSMPTCMNFLSQFQLIKYFMVQKGNLAVLKVAISPKPESPRPPKLVCMHLTSTYTCMNF